MANKVIKSFTVDKRVYDWLVGILKEANIGIGVSSIIDGYLKYLYQGLKEVLDYVKKNKVDIPLAFIVSKYIDDHADFFQYDWDAIEKLERKGKDLDLFWELKPYVDDLVTEYKKNYINKINKYKFIKTIDRVDR